MAIPATTASRDGILSRIRRANGLSVPDANEATRLEEWRGLPREYRRKSQSTPDQLQKLFDERLKHYEAKTLYLNSDVPLQEMANRADTHGTNGRVVSTRVAEILRSRGKKRLIVAPGLQSDYLPNEGFEFVPDEGLSKADLDTSDGVITTCTLAIALTGTIVLESAPEQGRRAITLVPDYHLCLLKQEDIVEFVPEAMARLQSLKSRPLTFFSGPSATVDIEMTTVRGVHGPRTLDVLII
jgi:L-lactate dehydrogenase complex protein LldG